MALLSLLYIVTLLVWSSSTMVKSQPSTLVKPGCQEKCGDVAIPYPFGVENPHCYMNPNFAVTCQNTSDGTLKPFVKSIGMELLGVSVQGYVQVNNPVISSNCSNRVDTIKTNVDISNGSFVYSSSRNRFTVMGCDNYAMLHQHNFTVGGCLSMCAGSSSSTMIQTGCYGIECCQTLIPPSINYFETNMSQVMNQSKSGDCRTASMVDQGWFDDQIRNVDYMLSIEAMKQREYIPAVLNWGYDQGTCDISHVSFCSSNGYCWEEIDQSHLCVCRANILQIESFDFLSSIEYIEGSCYGSDRLACLNTQRLANCRLLCLDSLRDRNCSCPAGYRTYTDGTCTNYSIGPYIPPFSLNIISIGCAFGLGLLFLLICVWWLYKIIKRRKAMKLKQKFFKRNGGLLLQQQLSSSTTNIEQTKLFSSTELEKATDNFHENRILGRGGQGTVYKGMLTDGRIVAVKKSKVIDEDKLDQFINEVVILSQINHRHVVRLLGCCLEAEVPFLVYEFISNGTLFHHIHAPNDDFTITWEMRLRIATEIASALSYLHSAASTPIYHRDIKSSNILLDEKYKAKVSDFGTSKSISIDQTHVTTRVQGTFGYLDPEYFHSSQFTDKSDVYSFGVVLAELITGYKSVFKTQLAEDKSLAYHFKELMEEDRLFEILDAEVAKEVSKEEIVAVADIANRCLNLKGRKRPTMKAVATKLEEIKASKGHAATDKHGYEEVDYLVDKVPLTSWDVTSSSTGSYNTGSITISVDADPLLSNT